MKLSPRVDEAIVASIDSKIEEAAFDDAKALVAGGYGHEPGTAEEVVAGSRFRIPVLLPEETETGDSRKFKENSTTVRDLPIPLLWQIRTEAGHDGSVVVARIDEVRRLDGDVKGWGEAEGVFDTGPYGREAERLVREKFLRGVSADLDMFEASVDAPEEAQLSSDDDDEIEDVAEKTQKIKSDKITVTQARITAATIVAKPAFQEATIELIEDEQLPEVEMHDGVYEEATDEQDFISASLVASAAPVVPPREWFTRPQLTKPTPITVTDEGRVFGHIAAWNTNHIGLPGNTRPPRSRSNYRYFRTGVVRTDDGTDVEVGQLTLAGGHAPMHASAADAVKHYDDTASALVDVVAGEDQFGIWVSGALRPDATPEQIRALRASAPSGDWRPINGRLELVAVCQVNVPGFPLARACVASGAITALVAAGARPIAELREAATVELENRLAQLETIEFRRQRELAAARLVDLEAEHDAAVLASATQRIEALEED